MVKQIFVRCTSKTNIINIQDQDDDIYKIISKQCGIEQDDYFLIHQGKMVSSCSQIQNNGTVDVSFRLLGGKGGFGSLLKSMATKVKVTDYGSSKNLNGRRIRNERNEKELLEFLRKKKKEEQMVKQEYEAYAKVKEKQMSGYVDIKLDKTYMEKLDSWDKKMALSVRKSKKRVPQFQEKTVEADQVQDLMEYDYRQIKKIKMSEEFKSFQQQKQTMQEESKQIQTYGSLSQLLTQIFEEQQAEENQNKNIDEPQKQIVQHEKQDQKEEKETFTEIDLNKVETVQDLEKFGLDHLKFQLEKLGLKCGGNLNQRAQRLLDIKNDSNLLFDSRYLAKKKI